MGGGKFNYVDSRLKDEIFSWADELKNVFEELECRGLKELTFKSQNMGLANSVRQLAQDAMRVTNETD